MNWYKKARLADKNYLEENTTSIHVLCQWCDRVATHPIENSMSEEHRIWKRIENLNPEERKQLGQADNLSHGACDICMGIAKKYKFQASDEKIKEESLGVA